MSGESGAGGGASSRSVASASSGVAKAKARTAQSIPSMRATGILREAPASALAAPGVPRSDKLEEDARRMEERLRQLKVAMTTEKQKREAITKTKAGTFWKAANPVADNKSYMEDVMARVEKRIAKSNAMAAAGGQAQGAGAQSQRGAAAAPVAGSAAVTGSNNLATTQQRPAAQRAASASKTGTAGSSAPELAATLKSSYVPPPKNSMPSSASRPQQQQQRSAGTVTAASNGATSARSSAASHAASSSAATPTGAIADNSGSGSNGFVNPADDDSRPAAPGSLLDGNFDEQENKRAFEEARRQWMAESSAEQQQPAGGNGAAKQKVQLVHDPDYSPAELASGDSEIGAGMGGGSLLSGPAFNERDSAREFAEARKAWMQSLADEKAAAPSSARKARAKPHSAADAADNSDGMWNPAVALGSGGSVLFPSEADDGAAPSARAGVSGSATAAAPSVSSALRSRQSALESSAKHACFHCYKLFYSAATTVRDERDFPGKPFCSPECLDQAAQSTKIRCAGQGCTRSLLRKEGERDASGHLLCRSCAANGGVAVPATATPEPTPSQPAPASPVEPLSPVSPPTPEPAAEPEAEEADVAQPAPIAAASAVAPLSRPTTAQRAVLDTSVIRQAPSAPAAQPVVEFPDDDDDV